jgi:DNA-binding CsgD family transcriptional regulator
MQLSRKLLQPVRREDYDAAFSKTHHADFLEIATYFEAAINHFKRFAIGNYFWFLADVTRGATLDAGGKIEELTAIKPSDFTHNSPELLFNQTHPEDLTHLFAFTNYWVSFITNIPVYKRNLYYPTIYIRLRNIDDLYKWCMVQYGDRLTDENGNILVGLTIVTDISHIKTEGPTMMSIVDAENEHCQHFYCQADNQLIESTKEIPKLSVREIEVLNLLAIGLSSKQIAHELSLSIKTVDNHRQNMLHKTKSKSSSELIGFAIKTGYL